MIQRLTIALCLLLPIATAAAPSPVSDPDLAGFTVGVEDLDVGYRIFPVFAMPGESVPLSTGTAGRFHITAAGGEVRDDGDGRWTWLAPGKPGHYPIDIERYDGAHMRIEAFVMVPADTVRRGVLNGYRIGHYPHSPLHGLRIYRAPEGFVEVTPELAELHVTPHFTLGQFLCKQAGDYPKYLVLRPLLLLKLEALVSHLAAEGVSAGAVHVMSGYRTPWYNEHLGDTTYSRHMWGDAADIYVDATAGFRDSAPLAADLGRLFQQPDYAYLQGGLGTYPATRNHPPFVHVDARGFQARW